MSTLFYNAVFNRPVQVTYLLVERIAALLTDSKPDEELALKAVSTALEECNLLDNPTPVQVEYVMVRLGEALPRAEEKTDGEVKDQEGKSYAGGFLKWVREMAPDDVCLFVAGNDYDKAYALYCTVDKEDVASMADRKVAEEWERARLQLEAALFGFGGGYGKSGDTDAMELGLQGGGNGEGFKALNEMLAFNG